MTLYVSQKEGIIEVREELLSFDRTQVSWWYHDLAGRRSSSHGRRNDILDRPMDDAACAWVTRHYLPRLAPYVPFAEESRGTGGGGDRKDMTTALLRQGAGTQSGGSPALAATQLQSSSVKPAQVRFISMYRGEAHYQVLDGPMSGRRVSVRSLDEAFYRNEWSNGRSWNMNQEAYERDIVGSAGIVNASGLAVTADVFAAIDSAFEENREAGSSRTHLKFCTGEWTAATGWTRTAMSSPPREVDGEDLVTQAVVESVASAASVEDASQVQPARMRL